MPRLSSSSPFPRASMAAARGLLPNAAALALSLVLLLFATPTDGTPEGLRLAGSPRRSMPLQAGAGGALRRRRGGAVEQHGEAGAGAPLLRLRGGREVPFIMGLIRW